MMKFKPTLMTKAIFSVTFVTSIIGAVSDHAWLLYLTFFFIVVVRFCWVVRQRHAALARMQTMEELYAWVKRYEVGTSYSAWSHHFDRQVLDLTKWRVRDFM